MYFLKCLRIVKDVNISPTVYNFCHWAMNLTHIGNKSIQWCDQVAEIAVPMRVALRVAGDRVQWRRLIDGVLEQSHDPQQWETDRGEKDRESRHARLFLQFE